MNVSWTTGTSATSAHVTWTMRARAVRSAHNRCGWWGVIDSTAHALRLPGVLLRPICDHYEIALGIDVQQIAPDYPDGLPWWLRPNVVEALHR